MNHLEFAELEARSLAPNSWDRWISRAKRLAGHDLDGDQSEDGYSLDFAYDAWLAKSSPEQYVASIRSCGAAA